MRKVFNNKGYSLVELIVAFTVVSLLLTALFMICSATYSTIETNRHDTHADIMLDNVTDYIKNTTGKTGDDFRIYEVDPSFDIAFSTLEVTEPGNIPYALAVVDGRLYDFGNVDGKTWNELTYSEVVLGDFRVFNDVYYNNTEIVMGFRRNAGSTKWAEVKICAHKNGNRITRTRTVNYSMLNDGAEILLFNASGSTLDDLGNEINEIVFTDVDGLIENKDLLLIYYKPAP